MGQILGHINDSLKRSRRQWQSGAVVVAQLAECLLPIPEVRGSKLVIGEILCWTYLMLTVEKTKKEAVNGPFKKRL